MVVTGFRGQAPGDPEVDTVRRLLEDGDLAGVILLQRNIASPDQLERLLRSFREAAGFFTPILSIDQEGGAVARLGSRNGFQGWMSAADVAALFRNQQEVVEYYAARAKEMAEVGINLNFGPVLDLNINPSNPIIGALGRSYGKSPKEVVRFAASFIDAHHQAGVMTCGKHFPGHGSSTTDSHMEATDISDTWSQNELQPFRTLSDAGLLDSVMSAHLLHPRFSDADGIPASLSRKTMEELRDAVGFYGAVFSDDMQMKAVSHLLPEAAAAAAAVAAGNTFLIYANHANGMDIGTAGRVNAAVAEAYAAGRISDAAWSSRVERGALFMARLK